MPTEYYNKLTNYGDTIVDFTHVKNTVLSQSEIEKTLFTNNNPYWDDDTILLAKNNQNTEAGNIIGMDGMPNKWRLNRTGIGSASSQLIAEMDILQLAIKDYTVSNQKNYLYQLSPISDTEIGSPAEQEFVTTMFNWCLIDLIPTSDKTIFNAGEKFFFDLDIKSGALSTETDRTEYETYTQFNKVSVGARKFIRGSLSSLIGHMSNNDYIDTTDFRQLLQTVISNGRMKLLKNRKGDVFVVNTHTQSNQFRDEIGVQPTDNSFDFMEIMNVKDITVIGEVI